MDQYRECPKCGSLIDLESDSCRFCKTKVSAKVTNVSEEIKDKENIKPGKNGLFSKMKQSYGNYQDKKSKERAVEEARQKSILSGEIKPIATSLNLGKDEKAYIIFSAQKMGLVAHMTSNTKKKGVFGRAVVGGVLLGPLGALGGAVTSGSKTTEKMTERIEELDNGTMIFTNKGFFFDGKKSMGRFDYDSTPSIRFQRTFMGSKLELKYPEMASGEFYSLSGSDSGIAELWYQGIRNKSNKGVK